MANITVSVTDANNITVQLTPVASQTITIDRGVAGNGISSIVPVTISTLQYLRIYYTNGTQADVGPLTSTAYFGETPITIVGNTISLSTVPINKGGTNATTAAAAIENLLPSYTGNGSKRLSLNSGATALEWVLDGGGTVTSVDVSGGTTGLTTSGGPITGSGTITLAGTLATTNGGTGLTSFTANGVVYASSTSALATNSALVFDGTNLGVGVSPASDGAIHVHRAGASFPTIKITNGTTGTGNLDGFDLICGSGGEAYVYNRENQPILFGVNNSEKMRIEAATGGVGAVGIGYSTLTSVGNNGLAVLGNVGIGTSSPGAKLEVTVASSDATLNQEVLRVSTTGRSAAGGTAGRSAVISFYDSANGTLTGAVGGFRTNSNVDFSGGLKFFYNSASASSGVSTLSQGMILDSSGNLGIGTPSPSVRLDVVTASGSTYINARRNSQSTGEVGLNLYGGTSGQNWGIYIPQSSNDLRFYTSGSDRVTIDSSGNLGLGVTPSGWFTSNNLKAVQLGGGSLVSYLNNQVWLASNYYLNSSGQDTYVGTGASNRLIMDGAYKFNIAPSGTAGNPITFTQAMTLDASGNLLVGVTSNTGVDTGVQRLVVTGIAGGAGGALGLISDSLGRNIILTDSSKTAVGAININSTSMSLGTNNGYPLVFNTNGTERARIDSSGNLGLGVTPSGWGSGRPAFQVKAVSVFEYSDGARWSYNLYQDGTNFKPIATGGYASYGQAGDHRWYIGSGTINVSTTPTQAMTLDASGNLLVGATTAYAKLKVGLTGSATTPIVNVGSFGAGGVVSLGSIANNSEQVYLGTGDANGDGIAAGIGFMREASGWNSALSFYTNNVTLGPNGASAITERARIDSSGNLLVGASITSSINGTFCPIQGQNNTANQVAYFRNTNANPYGIIVNYSAASPNNTGNEFIYCSDSTAQRFSARSNGGLANYSANNVNLSDRREKTNFAPAKSYLDVICAIPVQTFNYIDQNLEEDDGLTLGVVAQDVQAVAPELVMESNWGTKEEPKMRLSIYQTDLQYALMKCIQEQQAIIQSLTARITALEGA